VAFQYVGCASWHVGSANRHVAMQVDMWLCKSACGCASRLTIQMFKLLNSKPILIKTSSQVVRVTAFLTNLQGWYKKDNKRMYLLSRNKDVEF
jgi:hypothetical protein